jgi:hypothetical protein
MGRSFSKTDEDVENAEVAVLSDGLWRRLFGTDPSILGRRMTVDARPVTVVGVMPRGSALAFHVWAVFDRGYAPGVGRSSRA